MTNLIRVDARIDWEIMQVPNENAWIAICDSLGLTIESSSWRELAEDISEALDMVFADLIAENEWEQFLSQHGWSFQDEIPQQPVEKLKFDVPCFLSQPG